MARSAPANSKKAVVAAGAEVPLQKGKRTIPSLRTTTSQGWQSEAWEFYDLVGEYRYGVDLTANMVSKAKLNVQYQQDDRSYKTVTTGPVAEALDEFYNGEHSDFLRSAAINLTVPGEFFTVTWEQDGQRMWRSVPSESISATGETVRLDGRVLPGKALVFRQWEPHPVHYDRANSSSRALIPVLSEIHRLSQHIQAQIISRLASAGLLLISDQVDVSPPEGLVDEKKLASMSNGDKFVQQLTATMEQAIRDRSSASAVVPIVLQVPETAIESIKQLTFWSELDENSREMRDDAIRRLALGMDLPPESLVGSGEQNHWQAWLSDDTAIKAHTQPLLERITSGLTQAYLYPAIRGEVEDWQRYRIVADDSAMRVRPNRSKESIELYDRGHLSAPAMLRENGFTEEDAMDQQGKREWITLKVASGSTTPELVAAAIADLGVDLDPVYVDGDGQETQEARPDRSLKDHPTRDFPQDRPGEQKTPEGLVAACDVLTLRALERAGNRIKNVVQTRPDNITASEYYQFAPDEGKCSDADYLLTDAWAHVGEFATEYGLSEDGLTQALDAYTRQLILNKAPRDKNMLRRYLETVPSC